MTEEQEGHQHICCHHALTSHHSQVIISKAKVIISKAHYTEIIIIVKLTEVITLQSSLITMSSSVLSVFVVSSHKAVSPAHGDGSVSDFGLRMERPGPESESEEDVTSDQGGEHTTPNT